jgi:anti-sigma regulatory factor (Ser/Thr protein kinase)
MRRSSRPPPGVTVRVRADIDAFTAREETRKLGEKLGFPKIAIGELKIVASELASNIIKHTPGGEITIDTCRDGQFGLGLRLTAFDRGPSFKDLAVALRDGHDGSGPIDPCLLLGRRGIGGGLGAIVRFTDQFEYEVGSSGKTLRVVRFLQRPKRR